jgi:hypothetical protein
MYVDTATAAYPQWAEVVVECRDTLTGDGETGSVDVHNALAKSLGSGRACLHALPCCATSTSHMHEPHTAWRSTRTLNFYLQPLLYVHDRTSPPCRRQGYIRALWLSSTRWAS